MTDDRSSRRQTIVDLANDRGRVSLSDLATELEADSGTLFVEIESLIADGELGRLNHFTYGPADVDAPDDASAPIGPEATEAGEEAEEPTDDELVPPTGAAEEPSDDPVRAGPASARAISRVTRVVGVASILLGVIVVALGLVGLYLALIGGLLGALTGGIAGGFVGEMTPAMATGATVALVAVGGVSVLVGWAVFSGRMAA